MKKIIVLGDSHGRIFDGVFHRKEIQTTAYGLLDGEKGKELIASINKADAIVLSAGELDCRFHVNNQRVVTGTSYGLVIDAILERFVRYIMSIPVKVYVLGIPPAGWQKNIYGAPNYAAPEQHAEIYRMFHEKEMEKMEKFGITCIDMYALFVGPDGHFLPEWTKDGVHLVNSAVNVALGAISPEACWNRHCEEYQQDFEMLALARAKKLKEEKEKCQSKDGTTP